MRSWVVGQAIYIFAEVGAVTLPQFSAEFAGAISVLCGCCLSSCVLPPGCYLMFLPQDILAANAPFQGPWSSWMLSLAATSRSFRSLKGLGLLCDAVVFSFALELGLIVVLVSLCNLAPTQDVAQQLSTADIEPQSKNLLLWFFGFVLQQHGFLC
ncbi:hypothetical protein U1Q18_016207 [Sarracenia purpurea var. burkii]